jgi:hypothetical protein
MRHHDHRAHHREPGKRDLLRYGSRDSVIITCFVAFFTRAG